MAEAEAKAASRMVITGQDSRGAFLASAGAAAAAAALI
jgi:hypothetical protein